MLIMPVGFRHQYRTGAVVFDGTDDYLTTASDPSGAADSKVGIHSVWFKLNGGDGTDMRFGPRTGVGFFDVRRRTDNKIDYRAFSPSLTQIISAITTTTYTAGSAWRHLLVSWNLATSTFHLYVDDVDVLDTGTLSLVDDNIDHTLGEAWSIGATNTGGVKLNGEMAEFYFNIAEYLDLSVEANRRRFISGTKKPADLGPQGRTPTGNQPIIYLKGPASSFATNLGYGGNLTVSGALTDATTSPSG